MGIEYGQVNNYAKYGQPTLDLQFSGPKGSIRNRADGGAISVEFTRTQDTQASYYKSDGTIGYASTDVPRFDHDPVTGESLGLLIEESRTNSIPYSDHIAYSTSQGIWELLDCTVFPNAALSPDGAFTSIKLVENTANAQHRLETIPNYASTGLAWSWWVYAKAGERTTVELRFAAEPDANQTRFDLSSGTIINNPNNLGFIEPAANGWYKIGINEPSTGNNREVSIVLLDPLDSNNTTYTGDGTSGLYIWGVQLEQGTFPTSYIPTTPTFTSRASNATYYDQNGIVSTASTDVARDDAYFPDENGVFYPVGLLLEEEGTNLVDNSTNYTIGGWWDTQTNVVSTPNSSSSPDGSSTASLFTCSSGGGTGSAFVRRTAYSLTGGQPYTISTFAKASASSVIWVGIYSYDGPNRFIYFDLSAGTSSDTSGTSIQELTNGWYRCSVTATSATTGGANIGIGVCDAFGSIDCTLDGSKSVYLWGAQLEEGSYPTSYIPTTSGISTRAADISSSSTSTRGADTASITGAGFSNFYNQSEGTTFVDASRLTPTLGYYYSFNDGTISNTITGYQNDPFTVFFTRSVAGGQDQTAASAAPLHVKAAFGYKPSSSFAAMNGSQVGSTITEPNPVLNINNFKIGTDYASNEHLNGHISRITYWPTRLSDSDLQRLTE